MKKAVLFGVLSLVMMGLIIAGCDQAEDEVAVEQEAEVATEEAAQGVVAIAQLEPTEGNTARGTVEFTPTDEGVRVVANVSGLAPGEHGFHIHEFGDCSAPDAESAGGHYAPYGNPHGAPTDSVRHMGDLGNITVGADSSGQLVWVDPMIEMTGVNSIIGKSVIVHQNPDDFTTQPTGGAGPRLACGVIERVQQ